MTFLQRVVKALDDHGVRYAITGAYALSLHGVVRATMDIDLVIRLLKEDFLAAEEAFRSIGLRPRLPVTAQEVFDFREEYIQKRNLIAWAFVNPDRPNELVDVIITHDLRRMRVERMRMGNQVLKVLSVDDLIEMKRKSGREQDLVDIKALEKLKS